MINMSILEDYKGNHDEHRLPENDESVCKSCMGYNCILIGCCSGGIMDACGCMGQPVDIKECPDCNPCGTKEPSKDAKQEWPWFFMTEDELKEHQRNRLPREGKTQIPTQVEAITGEVKNVESYDDKCFKIFDNTELLDRDSLAISERIMFDHGAKVYTDRRGKNV